MAGKAINHVVYWTIPQLDADGVLVGEQHYALNLAEIDPTDAQRVESMLRSHPGSTAASGEDPHLPRTDPGITAYRKLFRPFIEVKNRADDLCRFSSVWLPFVYMEYAQQQVEPRHHTHPSVHRLAGAG